MIQAKPFWVYFVLLYVVKLWSQIVNVSLAVVILITTTGVTLNKHYCMGRLKSVSLNEQAATCFHGETEKMPCCEDVHEELKIKEVTTVIFDFDATPHLFQLATISFFTVHLSPDLIGSKPVPFDESPPPLPSRLRILHQVFLI
ncbi:MAG: hypothetical protein AAGA66_01625 [Bacteroidota bacterium]